MVFCPRTFYSEVWRREMKMSFYGDDVLNFAVTSKTVASGHSPSFGIGRLFWLPVI